MKLNITIDLDYIREDTSIDDEIQTRIVEAVLKNLKLLALKSSLLT